MKIVIETKYAKKAFIETAGAVTIVSIVLGPFIYSLTLDTPFLFLSLLALWANIVFFCVRYCFHESKDKERRKELE